MATIETVENVYWLDEDRAMICATVKFSDLDYKYGTSLTPDERIQERIDLYNDIINGVYGPIAPKPTVPNVNVVIPETI